jgi:hypothetical protein
MSNLRQVQMAMREVGPMADLLVLDEYESEQLWHIALDGETELVAELADERGTLVLSIPVGRPADPAALLELTALYAGLWRENDGSRLALDAPGGAMTLICEIGAPGLLPQTLAAAIRAAGERARGWRKILRGEGDTEEVAPAFGADERVMKV